MSDEQTPMDSPVPEPKDHANKLWGISPEVLAQVQSVSAADRGAAGDDKVPAGPLEKKDWDPGSLEHYKVLAEIGHPAAGRGVGTDPEQFPAAEKGVEPSPGTKEPAAKANEFLKPPASQPPSPAMQKLLETNREQVDAVARTVPEKGIKVQTRDAGAVKATPVAAPKERGAEGPSR